MIELQSFKESLIEPIDFNIDNLENELKCVMQNKGYKKNGEYWSLDNSNIHFHIDVRYLEKEQKYKVCTSMYYDK